MGKSSNPHENVEISTKEKLFKTSFKYENEKEKFSGVNIFVYILFFTSMGFSTYTFIQQMQYEDRIRKLQQLDDRISKVEEKLNYFPHIRTEQTNINSQIAQPLFENNASSNETFNSGVHNDELSHILQKLSIELSGIQRIRRDVKHLQSFRRGKRQTVQQTTECMCPPGMFYVLILFFFLYICILHIIMAFMHTNSSK